MRSIFFELCALIHFIYVRLSRVAYLYEKIVTRQYEY